MAIKTEDRVGSHGTKLRLVMKEMHVIEQVFHYCRWASSDSGFGPVVNHNTLLKTGIREHKRSSI